MTVQILKNRPLAVFCIALAITAVLGVNADTHNKRITFFVIAVLTALALLGVRALRRFKKPLTYLFYAILGISVALASSYLYFDVFFGTAQRSVGEVASLEGVILERADATSFSSTLCVRAERINGEKSTERVILTCEYPSALQVGERFSATVCQRAFETEDGYSEMNKYLSDGYTRIYVSESADSVTLLGDAENDPIVALRKWNAKLSARLYDAIGREYGAIPVALLLGNRGFVDGETTLHFQRAGISHLLALSGMHVAVLIGFLELVGKLLRLSKMTRACLVPPILILYLLLTGCAPSTVRAVLMMCVLYVGFLVRADYDSFVALCLVLAVYLTVTPYAVLDLSLWMSFLAAAGIIVFYPAIRTVSMRIRLCRGPILSVIRRPLAAVIELIGVGFFANAGIVLLSALMFGTVSLVGIPATILLSTPMSLLLILSIPTLLFPRVALLSSLCGVLSRLMGEVAKAFSEIPEVLLSMENRVEEIFLILFTLVVIVFAIVKCKHTVCFLVVILSMTAFLIASYLSVFLAPPMRMEYVSSSGICMVYTDGDDASVVENLKGTAREVSELVAFLKDVGYTEIDELTVSSYDNKRSYMIGILSERIFVRGVRLPTPSSELEMAIAKRIEEECVRREIAVRYDGDAKGIEAVGG